MACRHLSIRFLETGDVEYHLFRHHSKTMPYRYLIEWWADQVDILGGQCLEDHNYRATQTENGFLLLEWDAVTEADTRIGRGVNYVKRGFLARPASEPTLWHYQEQFKIKPDFSFWLHSPFERINAIQRRSSAVFRRTLGGNRSYLPRDLSECVFHEV